MSDDKIWRHVTSIAVIVRASPISIITDELTIIDMFGRRTCRLQRGVMFIIYLFKYVLEISFYWHASKYDHNIQGAGVVQWLAC